MYGSSLSPCNIRRMKIVQHNMPYNAPYSRIWSRIPVYYYALCLVNAKKWAIYCHVRTPHNTMVRQSTQFAWLLPHHHFHLPHHHFHLHHNYIFFTYSLHYSASIVSRVTARSPKSAGFPCASPSFCFMQIKSLAFCKSRLDLALT